MKKASKLKKIISYFYIGKGYGSVVMPIAGSAMGKTELLEALQGRKYIRERDSTVAIAETDISKDGSVGIDLRGQELEKSRKKYNPRQHLNKCLSKIIRRKRERVIIVPVLNLASEIPVHNGIKASQVNDIITSLDAIDRWRHNVLVKSPVGKKREKSDKKLFIHPKRKSCFKAYKDGVQWSVWVVGTHLKSNNRGELIKNNPPINEREEVFSEAVSKIKNHIKDEGLMFKIDSCDVFELSDEGDRAKVKECFMKIIGEDE